MHDIEEGFASQQADVTSAASKSVATAVSVFSIIIEPSGRRTVVWRPVAVSKSA